MIVFSPLCCKAHKVITYKKYHSFNFMCKCDWFACCRRSCPLHVLTKPKPLIGCMHMRRLICMRWSMQGTFLPIGCMRIACICGDWSACAGAMQGCNAGYFFTNWMHEDCMHMRRLMWHARVQCRTLFYQLDAWGEGSQDSRFPAHPGQRESGVDERVNQSCGMSVCICEFVHACHFKFDGCARMYVHINQSN